MKHKSKRKDLRRETEREREREREIDVDYIIVNIRTNDYCKRNVLNLRFSRILAFNYLLS